MKRRNFLHKAAYGGLALTGVTGSFATGHSRPINENGMQIKEFHYDFKALSGFQPLVMDETQSEIRVKGGTFEYTISKMNGLFSSARVLGDEWLAGPLPDLWASPANDPRTMKYFARLTSSAEVKITEPGPDRVVIASRGVFTAEDSTTLPLNYNLLYTFDIDGTARVDLKVSADEKVVLRWLTLLESRISDACSFVSHEYDLGNGSRTCSPTNYDVSGQKEIKTGGKFIPWFHFGNDRCGLELVFPYSDRRHGSYTDSSPFEDGDPLGLPYDLFTLSREGSDLLCTCFAIRNMREVIGPNFSFEDTFYVSALPGRTVRSKANSVQTQWIGPHQYRNNWKHPGEEEIKSWAAGGVNTVVGGANWYSGNYSNCSMPDETKQFLETCHRYGLRVIPYITFTDQEYPTPGFDETGPGWRIEPVTEFNYRSQLMCYGAAGWQEHWHNQIKQIFDQFPFDGLYIDFWAGKVNCYNSGHGCVGPYGRFTIEGLRKMARIAREIVDTKTKDGIILSNTNILPLAMVNNWMDARLYGEWHNLEETDPLALRIYYNAHRYGTGNVLYCQRVPAITGRTLALSGLFQGYPVISHARTPEQRGLLERNALLLHAFGANRSIALNKFEMGEVLPSDGGASVPGVSLYYRPDNGNLLICLSTFSQPASTVQLGPILKSIISRISGITGYGAVTGKSSYYIYVFEDKDLIGGSPLKPDQLSAYTINLPAENYRNIWLKPAGKQPSILYSLSNGDAPVEDFKAGRREFSVTIPSRARDLAETVVLGAAPRSVKAHDREISFKAHKGWWEGEFPCNTTVRILY
ncbi:MAG TPA: hypothetical protein PLM01_13730 [Bacteroidales bacterium]|jgi:hypothetical protein|nr:hypothetical protein [Bacteroidales bacterium]HQJ83556.1 hypothetical protein [Bacteroidales bacterium]